MEVLREIAFLIVIGGGSALLVRFALPAAVHVATLVLVEILSVVAALALLPDVIVAGITRRRGAAPPQWVYEYGGAIGGTATVFRLALRHTSRGLIGFARQAPLALIAVVAVGIRLVGMLT